MENKQETVLNKKVSSIQQKFLKQAKKIIKHSSSQEKKKRYKLPLRKSRYWTYEDFKSTILNMLRELKNHKIKLKKTPETKEKHDNKVSSNRDYQ